jgi:hypothetical protein
VQGKKRSFLCQKGQFLQRRKLKFDAIIKLPFLCDLSFALENQRIVKKLIELC